jgi:hypothetical protein
MTYRYLPVAILYCARDNVELRIGGLAGICFGYHSCQTPCENPCQGALKLRCDVRES